MMNHATSLAMSIATGRALSGVPSTARGRCARPWRASHAAARSTASWRSPCVMTRGGARRLCAYCAQKTCARLYVALNSTTSGSVSRCPASGGTGVVTLIFGRTNGGAAVAAAAGPGVSMAIVR